MSESANTEQPKPQATDRKPVWPMVIEYVENNYLNANADENDDQRKTVSKLLADMQIRHQTGIQRYGVPLTSGNGRDAMVDAYQELLDFVVYTRTWLDERGLVVLQPSIAAKAAIETQTNDKGELVVDVAALMLDPMERVMVNLFSAATEALLQMRGMLTMRGVA